MTEKEEHITSIFKLDIYTVVIKCVIIILLEVPDFQGGVSRTQTSLLESENREDLRMTLELVLAVVAAIINCIATVASAVIATLSYLKNKKS